MTQHKVIAKMEQTEDITILSTTSLRFYENSENHIFCHQATATMDLFYNFFIC